MKTNSIVEQEYLDDILFTTAFRFSGTGRFDLLS